MKYSFQPTETQLTYFYIVVDKKDVTDKVLGYHYGSRDCAGLVVVHFVDRDNIPDNKHDQHVVFDNEEESRVYHGIDNAEFDEIKVNKGHHSFVDEDPWWLFTYVSLDTIEEACLSFIYRAKLDGGDRCNVEKIDCFVEH
jgi:hypothetical protein